MASDEDKAAARLERVIDAANEAVLIFRQDVAEGAEADGEVKAALEAHLQGVALFELKRRRRVCLGVKASASLVEHALGQVDADDLLGAQAAQVSRRGAGAAAHVEATLDVTAARHVLKELLQQGVWCSEGGVLKLRRDEVVAFGRLDERLMDEFRESRAVRVKHGLPLCGPWASSPRLCLTISRRVCGPWDWCRLAVLWLAFAVLSVWSWSMDLSPRSTERAERQGGPLSAQSLHARAQGLKWIVGAPIPAWCRRRRGPGVYGQCIGAVSNMPRAILCWWSKRGAGRCRLGRSEPPGGGRD